MFVQGDEELSDDDTQFSDSGDEDSSETSDTSDALTPEEIRALKAELETLRGSVADTEKFKDLIEELKSQGFEDSAAFRAAVEQANVQNLEQTRLSKENQSAETYWEQLASRGLTAGDGSEEELELRRAHHARVAKINAEHKEAKLQAAEKRIAALEQKEKFGGTVSEKIAALLKPTRFPYADKEALLELAKANPKADLEKVAKSLHLAVERRLGKYDERQNTKKNKPSPESGGGYGTPSSDREKSKLEAMPSPFKDPEAFKLRMTSINRMLAQRRNAARR